MLSIEDIMQLLAKFVTDETKFIGLGFMIDYRNPKAMSYYGSMGTLFWTIRKTYPNMKIIVGGSTAFRWSKLYQNKSLFNYIIQGYGEDQTLGLFNHHYKGTPLPPFEVVDGNIHLSEHLVRDKEYVFNSSTHEWDLSDCIQPGESLPIEFARGCIFKCSFCRYPHIGKGKDEYAKHVECIKQELISNYQKFGTTTYFVTDDTLNADTDFVREFTEMVKTLPFKLQYGAYLRGDLLQAHPEQEDMFIENGLVSAFFGIESFNKEAAAFYGKPWSAKKGKTYISYLNNQKWKDKVNISLGLICGSPFETLEDYRATDEWCKENNIPCWIWHPLSVARIGNYYMSELDQEFIKHGFSFKLSEGNPIWYHDKCDQNKAFDWSIELYNDTRAYQTPSTWVLIELATYGYKFDRSLFWKYDGYNWTHISTVVEQILSNYKRDLLAL
jgi:radical SAM superfamily enzyme YgiQ (UPF0313 family)